MSGCPVSMRPRGVGPALRLAGRRGPRNAAGELAQTGEDLGEGCRGNLTSLEAALGGGSPDCCCGGCRGGAPPACCCEAPIQPSRLAPPSEGVLERVSWLP